VMPCGVRLAGATDVMTTVFNFAPLSFTPMRRAAKRGSY